MRIRLFCFPSAGAGALIYRPWLSAFPRYVEVIPVELPGRGARAKETPFVDVRGLANKLIQGLASSFEQPYALFGHSVGALLAFEIALQAKTKPEHLFVSAHRSPECHYMGRVLHTLPDVALCNELSLLGGMSAVLLREPDVMRLLLPVIRADLRMTEAYLPRKTSSALPCPVTAFGAVDDPRVPLSQMKDWRLHTTQSFNLHAMRGGHFYLQRPDCPLVGMIAAALKPQTDIDDLDCVPHHESRLIKSEPTQGSDA
jgi:medium-chain acyl-[acyl-carrier-protein] hydrolase